MTRYSIFWIYKNELEEDKEREYSGSKTAMERALMGLLLKNIDIRTYETHDHSGDTRDKYTRVHYEVMREDHKPFTKKQLEILRIFERGLKTRESFY